MRFSKCNHYIIIALELRCPQGKKKKKSKINTFCANFAKLIRKEMMHSGRMRQENFKFEHNLGNLVKVYLKIYNKKRARGTVAQYKGPEFNP